MKTFVSFYTRKPWQMSKTNNESFSPKNINEGTGQLIVFNSKLDIWQEAGGQSGKGLKAQLMLRSGKNPLKRELNQLIFVTVNLAR